ncbi:EAL domain-containing protein [Ectothiorhodospiraceae bacterium 2226]|nr:EAL domain-containing protein [Ectothiorhodospiraceae bacterium 2226]
MHAGPGRWDSLRARLLLLVLFAMLPSVALLAYSVAEQHRQAAQRAEHETLMLVQAIAREQALHLATTRLTLRALAKLPALRAPGGACDSLLASLLSAHPYYTNLAAATPEGDVYCSGLPFSSAVNAGDHAFFRRTLETQAFSAGDYQVGRITGLPAVNFGYPILDSDGELAGVAFAALDLEWVKELTLRAQLPRGAVLLMIDPAGGVIARIGHDGRWLTRGDPAAPLRRALATDREGGTVRVMAEDGTTRLHAYAPFYQGASGTSYVSVGVPAVEALAVARGDLLRNLGLLLLVASLAIFAAWFGSEVFLLRRVRALGEASRRLAQGDLKARSGLQRGGDELGCLAAAFDDMAGSLQRVNRALRTLSAGNRALVRATDEHELLQDICRIVVEVGGYRCAWVCHARHTEADKVAVEVWAAAGPAATTAPPIDAQTLAGLDAGAPLVVKRCGQGHTEVPDGCRALAVLPLRADGESLGALVICAASPDCFDAEALELLEETAGDLAYGIGNLRARSERRQAQDLIERMAYHDTLTGLPNQAAMEQHLRTSLGREGGAARGAMLMVDLERFREINEALGFHQGDQLLKAAAQRLSEAVPGGAMVARLRGDEFAVLLSPADADTASSVAQGIREALDRPFPLGGLSLRINAVIGIALAPEHGDEPARLGRHADVAVRQAKRSRRPFAVYDPSADEDGPQRLALASDLRHAIDAGALDLYYQPKIDLRQNALCGVEALVRWRHPVRGMVSPDEFVSLAEHTGLIKPLTLWVLEQALGQAAAWRSAGVSIPIAVNLSAWNLRDRNLLPKIEELFARWGAGPGWLDLEITESAMMEDPEGAVGTLRALSALGIGLFIDDFGTGYSSLSYLTKLPVNAVKIDKSFVMDMLSNPQSAAVVHSTIGLAHDLQIAVVAEGVEDAIVSERLANWGCDVGQGYFYGRPAPAEELVVAKGRITRCQ